MRGRSVGAVFLRSEGLLPSNEGRGDVLRKIIRRAIRHGLLRGVQKPFLHEMVGAVVTAMGLAYPDLRESAERVTGTILSGETRFSRTLPAWAGMEEESAWTVLPMSHGIKET